MIGMGTHISRHGKGANTKHFCGSTTVLPLLCPLSVLKRGGGGRMGYIRKAFFKGYLEYPGLHAEVTI